MMVMLTHMAVDRDQDVFRNFLSHDIMVVIMIFMKVIAQTACLNLIFQLSYLLIRQKRRY